MAHRAAQQPQQPQQQRRYDRQLRIWGDAGQSALRAASLCAISATAAAAEAIKNLVLPAIGALTLVDGTDLRQLPPTAHFFLSSPQRPHNRAHALVAALHALNSDVRTSFIPHHAHEFIDSVSAAYAFVLRFSLVLVADMPASHTLVRFLSQAAFRANVPLVLLRCHGMIGYLRVQAPTLCVLNARQDDLPPDLCIHAPFSHLQALADATDLNAISDTTQLTHVPFVIILTKALQLFRAQNDQKLPASPQQNKLFENIVRSLRPSHCPADALNFEEALKRSNLRLCYSQVNHIPPSVQAVLSHPNADPRTSTAFSVQLESPNHHHVFPQIVHYTKPRPAAHRIAEQQARFWLIAAAVNMFVNEAGRLPVRGSLPDMTADTESYLNLQRIYSEKAHKDAKRVLHFVHAIVDERGLDLDVDDALVISFCTNVHAIRVHSTSSISDELDDWNVDAFKEAAMLEGGLDPSGTGKASPYYPILRAVDLFHRANGRYPGSDTVVKDNDIALMHGYVATVKEQLGLQSNTGLWRHETEEMVRYANTELHNVAAFMGGIAAQEITKILTQQFVPLDNTLIVNMAEQSSITFAA
ncbi:NEDD8-activating enzyme E1 regulatory subunit [Gracilariopsis chorda]|uniref:NEDD8-activating enzyme E1 regulatory subunit n=1 Tax=Gracilariopsis chorda TaxID=448386 RepID=A0A2V3J185_9FLOR|nr:NEDD8-activating enzyme E1 regulatory subunit [Gracilariopsis chorda]|eukprot:PXF47707.1 NEDD8-activating enzyme E1 regulatory subunit [Gracilariopsis chorda]